jgi:hypothetical protein
MGIFLPLLSIPCVRPAATCLALCVMLAGSLRAQTGASPVFKSYTPPRPGAIVEQSDVTYQLWHTFDLTRRAGAGDVLAQQELAVRYLTGRGVKADTVRGAFWTISAAAQNMPPARFNLGILSSNGWGVAWNPFEAYDQFLWYAASGKPRCAARLERRPVLVAGRGGFRLRPRAGTRGDHAAQGRGGKPGTCRHPRYCLLGFSAYSRAGLDASLGTRLPGFRSGYRDIGRRCPADRRSAAGCIIGHSAIARAGRFRP